LAGQVLSEQAQTASMDLQQRIVESRQLLLERLTVLETFNSRSTDLAQRLYDAVIPSYRPVLAYQADDALAEVVFLCRRINFPLKVPFQ
jgi:hypothetical protein